MAYFQHGDTTLYYNLFPSTLKQVSSPPPLLLLHGFAGTPESDFAPLLPQLQTHFTLLAPHLHGNGRSSQRTHYPPSYYRADVADIIALLDALSIPEVLISAFSDGGIVALLLAALHPERVRAVTTLGAQATLSAEDVAAIRYAFLERPLSQEWQTELAQLHGEPYWHTLLALYVQGQESLLAEGGILITGQELAAIRCPTLLMHGKRDRVVAVGHATALQAQIKDSHLHLFDAGHAAHLRCVEEYKEVVLSFLLQHSKQMEEHTLILPPD